LLRYEEEESRAYPNGNTRHHTTKKKVSKPNYIAAAVFGVIALALWLDDFTVIGAVDDPLAAAASAGCFIYLDRTETEYYCSICDESWVCDGFGY
jgi:hypothetical protein